MRIRLLIIFILLVACNTSFAQLVGANTYLQGRYLEIGIIANGAFGAPTPPAGYHPHPAGPLGEVYDWGHDGWTVGTPAYMGDYTYPGTPQEGWAIQVNGQYNDAYQAGGYAGPGSLAFTAGSRTYSNTGGTIIGNWAGTAGGLTLTQQTRIDTLASWVVVTTTFTNPTAAAIPGVYYERTCDPDDDETWIGSAGFTTINTVTYQNDPDHRVEISAWGQGYPAAEDYMGICTKDCRAKAFVINGNLFPNSTDLATMYAGGAGAGASYALGYSQTQDEGIGVVWSLGTIAAGGNTSVSYAYIFNNSVSGIDSAFPEPTLVVNGVSIAPTGPAPDPTVDTFNACLYPGMTVLPVNINFASDKDWTGSTWTWSPSTGLSSTTGVTTTINLNSLPPIITYTITGTNAAYCNARVMYLTVKTCNGATVNNPCLGNPLTFNAPGDSTGATYSWYGPAPATTVVATTQSFTITSVWADTGTYHVIKTVAGVSDTSVTIASINPNPVVTAGSNSPLCAGLVDTLLLNSTSTVTPATYSWTGPGGFTSTLQNPTIPGFVAADAGTYIVTATSSFGCTGTANTTVVLLPPPGPPTITDPNPYCQGAAPIPFNITATGTVWWYPTAAGTGGTTTIPTISTAVPGSTTYYFNQTIGRCVSSIDSITIVVIPAITADFSYIIHRGCNSDLVTFTSNTTNATTYSWDFGDGTSPVTTPNAAHTYLTQGTYVVTLTCNNVACQQTVTHSVDTKHNVIAAFTVSPDTFCAFNPLQTTTITNNSVSNIDTGGITVTSSATATTPSMTMTFNWDFGDGSTSTVTSPAPHSYTLPGTYVIKLTTTDSIGCVSNTQDTVVSVGLYINSFHDTTLCLRQPLPLNNTEILVPPLPSSYYNYTYSWTQDTLNLSDPTIQVPSVSGFGTFTDILTVGVQSGSGSWGVCYALDTIIVNSVLGQVLTNVTSNEIISYGSSIQLNSDNEQDYYWVPNDGSLNNPNINNPVATPQITTTYTVYGMDQYGCVDSAFVTITVDSTMTEEMPSAFSPNGDGLNDVFRPIGLKYQRLVEFRIYNRWGQQVFYSNNIENGWDGTFNGVKQDIGVYFYQVIVGRPGGVGENIMYKGDVTLIR